MARPWGHIHLNLLNGLDLFDGVFKFLFLIVLQLLVLVFVLHVAPVLVNELQELHLQLPDLVVGRCGH